MFQCQYAHYYILIFPMLGCFESSGIVAGLVRIGVNFGGDWRWF